MMPIHHIYRKQKVKKKRKILSKIIEIHAICYDWISFSLDLTACAWVGLKWSESEPCMATIAEYEM